MILTQPDIYGCKASDGAAVGGGVLCHIISPNHKEQQVWPWPLKVQDKRVGGGQCLNLNIALTVGQL